jgi:hypothetical protein
MINPVAVAYASCDRTHKTRERGSLVIKQPFVPQEIRHSPISPIHVHRHMGALLRAPEGSSKIRSSTHSPPEDRFARQAHHAEAFLEASRPRRVLS